MQDTMYEIDQMDLQSIIAEYELPFDITTQETVQPQDNTTTQQTTLEKTEKPGEIQPATTNVRRECDLAASIPTLMPSTTPRSLPDIILPDEKIRKNLTLGIWNMRALEDEIAELEQEIKEQDKLLS